MKMKTKFIGALAAVSMMVSPSFADGLSLGIIGNWADFKTSGYEKEGGFASTATSGTSEITNASITKSVDYASFFAEYMVGPDQGFNMTFGFERIPDEAEIGAKSRTDANDSDDTSDDGTYTGKAKISDHTSIYFEPTLMANEYFGVYLKGGGTRIKVSSQESLAFGANSSTYGDENVWGLMYGLGLKGITPWGIGLKTEYVKTEYGTVTLHSTTGNRNVISADPEQESFRVALFYNF